MANNKEKVFENNPYWDENSDASQNKDKTVIQNEIENVPNQQNEPLKTIQEEDTVTSDYNPSLDEPFPEVSVCEQNDGIVFTIKDVSFKMVKVEGGTFTMGVTEEPGKKKKNVFIDELPAHKVSLNSFYICDTTVTQELWKAIYPTADITIKAGRENLPKVKISWADCQRFINKLNQITGRSFRMPTEAEWEYAAKGGLLSKNNQYSGSNSVSFVAWYNTSNKPIQPVKKLRPNELNLYDMSGNVCEWCADWYANDYYANSPENNPQGPDDGQYRVVRGGSVFSTADSCRITMRMNLDPKLRESAVGLRLVL